MAAPNIRGLSILNGNLSVLNVSTVSSNIIANPVSSNKVLKINSLYISNIDGLVAADITASLLRGGVGYALVSTVAVPPDASLVAISKDTSIYLEEGDAIRLLASANGDLQAICSYEEIS